jgi:redox-sensing transcriptional repressor
MMTTEICRESPVGNAAGSPKACLDPLLGRDYTKHMSKPDPCPASPGSNGGEPRLSRACVGRFSLYLRHLERFHHEGVQTVSSSQLGVALGITDAQVRKDLAYLGNLGHPGIGYPAQDLMNALRVRLGIDRQWAAVVVGVGNLARALLRYRGFEKQGFRFAALFDADPSKVGLCVDGLEIYPPERMAEIIQKTGAELGVVAVPAEAAQTVANTLVAAGIRGILNFAPTTLHLPPTVKLVAVDLAVQLEQLAFLVHLGQEKAETR